MSTAGYSQGHSYTAKWTGASWVKQKCPISETTGKGIRIQALSIESPAFYRWASTSVEEEEIDTS